MLPTGKPFIVAAAIFFAAAFFDAAFFAIGVNDERPFVDIDLPTAGIAASAAAIEESAAATLESLCFKAVFLAAFTVDNVELAVGTAVADDELTVGTAAAALFAEWVALVSSSVDFRLDSIAAAEDELTVGTTTAALFNEWVVSDKS